MRTLPAALSSVMASLHRQPRYQVLLWDILSSGAPTITSIVNGTAASAFQVDVTAYVHGDVSVSEQGDKRAAQVALTLSDHLGSFDPVSGTYAAYLHENQVVHIRAGDATVTASNYVGLFFGHCRGQAGFHINRQSLQRETTLSLYGRRATPAYVKRRFISPSYGNAVDFGVILRDIARDQMSLAGNELARFPHQLEAVTQFTTNSIVDLSPLEALDKILEAVGLASDFDGDGGLRQINRDLRRAPEKIYPNLHHTMSVEVPASDTETYNSVKIIGLDKYITEIDQPVQDLARATIPVGFWRPTHSVQVVWSKDRSVRAYTTAMQVQTSINETVLFNIGEESYTQVSEYEGKISVSITKFIVGLLLLITIQIALTALIPDKVVVGGVLASFGWTIPFGRIFEGIVIATITYTLSLQSSGEYLIVGSPRLPVFKEISVVLTQEGTPDYLLNQKELQNDWVNTHEHLLQLAMVEILFEVAQGKPRRVTMLDDYTLEVGDIIQIPLGNTPLRLWIESLNRTLSRDAIPTLTLQGYLIPTEGI